MQRVCICIQYVTVREVREVNINSGVYMWSANSHKIALQLRLSVFIKQADYTQMHETSSGVLLGVIIASSTTQRNKYTLEEWPRKIL